MRSVKVKESFRFVYVEKSGDTPVIGEGVADNPTRCTYLLYAASMFIMKQVAFIDKDEVNEIHITASHRPKHQEVVSDRIKMQFKEHTFPATVSF